MMGHYRSEMVDDTDRSAQIKQRRKNLETNIENAIERKGIAAVLADIVDDLGLSGYANNMRLKRDKNGDIIE